MDIETPIFKPEKILARAKLVIGDTTIYLDKELNWFQRKMYKIFFNITAENIREVK